VEMQQVRYFIALAQTLNFTRAAEACNVTQPALTRAIKQLEFELGGDLIRREGRRSHLTELGNRMLPVLRQCFEAAQSAKLLAKAVSKGQVPTLSIAVARTIDTAMLMDPLHEMYRAFEGIQLKLKRGSAQSIVEMLKSGDVDLALGGPLGDTWDRLETWPMFSESFDLIVGVDHALANRNDVDLDIELIANERVLVHRGADLSPYEVDRFSAAGIDLANAHEVDSDRDLRALVAAGFGVGVAPSRALSGTDVKHVQYPALDLQRTVAVYTVAGRPRSRESAALLALLRGADWLGGRA
jgi:DNA-binding transcriptional LysR family regulator